MNAAEWLTAAGTVGTFIVIAVSAVAAFIQLRHVRSGNQFSVLSELQQKMDSPDFKKAVDFIRYEFPERIEDPAFRRQMLANSSPEAHMLRDIAQFLDLEAAQVVKHHMVPEALACDWLYVPVVPCWDALAPLIASRRAVLGYRLWEDFEYLAFLCKRFRERHPSGTYPKGTPGLPLPEPWPEALQGNQ